MPWFPPTPNRTMDQPAVATPGIAQPIALPASWKNTSAAEAWPLAEVEALFALPFADLMHRAQSVHREHHDPNKVQLSTLLSIKTGGCPEDCGYCPQSARHDTGVASQEMLPLDDVGLPLPLGVGLPAAGVPLPLVGGWPFCGGAACSASIGSTSGEGMPPAVVGCSGVVSFGFFLLRASAASPPSRLPASSSPTPIRRP